MDFTPVIYQIIETFWYLIPLVILAAIFKSRSFKGKAGEFSVNLSAKLFLNKKDYHLIKNVTLPSANGTTQIDHIIVSKYGVFVIETKNMHGWIFGSSKQRTWTQKIYQHSTPFQNPLYQNYKHLKTLESLLDLKPYYQLFSVIVFVGDSQFKTEMPENVTQGKAYLRFIKSKKQLVLTESEVETIIKKIANRRLKPCLKTNRDHIKHVKTIVAAKEKKPEKKPICPECGDKMLLREAKKGRSVGHKFWGCSSFPKCRVTINIQE